MTLEDLGWNEQFGTVDFDDRTPARVTAHHRNRYRIEGPFGASDAVLPGRDVAESAAMRPAVGDWVLVDLPSTGDLAVIRKILPRRTAFSRNAAGDTTSEQIVAANIDFVLIVVGLDGDFNLRRIERYVIQAWSSGATPVLVLNKMDICEDVDGMRIAAEAVAPGVAVFAICAVNGSGVESIEGLLTRGITAALVGSSGAGKSTLVNSLVGCAHMKTAEVRSDDSRGRHTTTHRELIQLPFGGLLIDTPGMRELQLWASDEGLAQGFGEIDQLARACRYSDCTHVHEPECAVREAVDAGRLDQSRYECYLKLQREMAYHERRRAEAHAERKLGKEGARLVREVNRYHPKRRFRDR